LYENVWLYVPTSSMYGVKWLFHVVYSDVYGSELIIMLLEILFCYRFLLWCIENYKVHSVVFLAHALNYRIIVLEMYQLPCIWWCREYGLVCLLYLQLFFSTKNFSAVNCMLHDKLWLVNNKFYQFIFKFPVSLFLMFLVFT
jgi:hypothetical protein